MAKEGRGGCLVTAAPYKSNPMFAPLQSGKFHAKIKN